MATSPDSIAYPDQTYGVLGPLPAGWADVVMEGADPTGVDDSTDAFENALALIPNGGRLLIPPGEYLISRALALSSGTVVSGSGWGSRIIVAPGFVNPGNNDAGTYSIFHNENHAASVITDSDIAVENLAFDNSANPSYGAFHHVNFRMAQRVSVVNCFFDYGGNATACRGCTNVRIVGNSAYNFRNCGYDHWEGCEDVLVEGNYAKSSTAVQMVNFNPETEPPYATGTVARRFRMIGNTLDGSGAVNVIPCQIEPLTANSTWIEDATIVGNTFYRVRLACRGDVRGLTITGNTFRDIASAAEVIGVYPRNGGTPSGVDIIGNNIAGPETTGGNGGVIRCQTDQASVIGNTITGAAYTGQAIYVDTAQPNVLGNRTDIAATPGTLQTGFRLLNSSNNYIGILDASGTTGLRVYCQADNSLVFQTTDSTGAARPWMTLAARSSTSGINWPLPAVFSDLVRIAPATALTATGTTSGTALVLSKNYNEVTTVAASTGVRLPTAAANQVTGARIVVWNAGANTLNVYPMVGGQIDALGTDIADTIAAGSCKTYVAMSSTLYRIET